MGEKGSNKISLSGFFLILAIIVIIVMSYFVYKLYNDKKIETEKVLNLNSQISNLENTVNNLQEKIDSNSNTVNSNDLSNNSNTTMTEVEAKKLVEEKLNLALKLTELGGGFKTEYNKSNNTYPVVNYQEICDKYMTSSYERYFRNHLWTESYWENDILYLSPSDVPSHEIEKIEFLDLKIYNNDIKANLKIDFMSYGISTARRNYNCDFEIINENGDWKINNYTLTPNGDWVYDENFN